ncbi:MAG TPA: flavodoxin-dependent (E)-4-hydroxy-3-methylbut-2-enyl-diphosphate synthase, partial [Candidatus Norongarragalinales archaeon]|nr:flavodoxin-dependent (E)-4-hydroxy-3-methylbut-2-enyl-diphosphate synthase [Candidatus Norongarragalinales archaeon]
VQKTADDIFLDAMVESAVQSVNKATELGLPANKIIVSCKVSDVQHLVHCYTNLAKRIPNALHLGLTEAGLGSKGIVAATLGIGIMLNQGVGDTIRVSITPKPGEPRTTEVVVCQQILQTLGVRSFTPLITSCPGCGRTTSTVFQELGVETEKFLRERSTVWKNKGYVGFESMRVAVMGCIVNGPGEAKDANIGISLPGTGEQPTAPVYADGKPLVTLKGDAKTLAREFHKLVDDYVEKHYAPKTPSPS